MDNQGRDLAGGPVEDGLRDALRGLLRARYSIARGAILLAGFVSVVGLMTPRTYSAMASFTPQARRGSSYASSIAAQFGISGLSGGEATQTPQFYVDLLRSPTFLREVVGRTYSITSRDGSHSGTLVELFRAAGSTPAQRLEAAAVGLSRQMRIAASTRTGVVTVWVSTQWPELSKVVVDTVLSALNSYNNEKRQSQASVERRFTESRRDTALIELRSAEDRLLQFVQANRNFAASPSLAVQFDRLNREVQRLQQVYSGLSQAFEQARIDEVRDTPVISVIDAPVLPADADRRRLFVKGILSLFVGALAGFAVSSLAGRLLRKKDEDTSLENLLGAIKEEARHPLTAIRRFAGLEWNAPA